MMVFQKKCWSGNVAYSLFGMLLTTLMAMFSACSDKDDSIESEKVPMQVKVVNGMAVSRGLITEEHIPSGSIGVTILDMEGNDYDGIEEYKNIKYETYDGNTWLTEIIPGLTLRTGKAVAYYPYKTDVQDMTAIPVHVDEQEDVMYSGWVENISSMQPEVTFRMNHALAAVRVKLKKEATHTGSINVSDVSIQSDGFYTSATFDASTGTLANQETPGAKILKADLDLELDVAGKEIDFVVIPTETHEIITFMTAVNDNQYFSEITPSSALLPGHIHTFTFVLTAEGAQLEGVTVNRWQMVVEGDTNNMDFYDDYYQNGVICTYFKTSDGSMQVANSVSNVSKMMVDGVEVTPSTSINVTAGEHVVKFLFKQSNGEYIVPSSVFKNVSSCLKSVYISRGITYIGSSAFYGCSSLNSVDFSNATSLELIYDYAFYQNTSLKSIDLSKAVKLTRLGNTLVNNYNLGSTNNSYSYIFYQCSNLESINLPASLTEIGNGVFWECSNLRNIVLPSSITKLGIGVFGHCDALTSVDLSNCELLTIIPTRMFYECNKLETVVFPNTITEFYNDVFYKCRSLKSIDLTGCTSLKSLGTWLDNASSSSGSYWLVGNFYGCSALESVKLPNSIEKIQCCSFNSCGNLKNINIPSNLSVIYKEMFYGCNSLTSIDIPEKVHTIKESAFYGCGALAEITIPDNVVTIENKAFKECGALAEIIVPNSVTSFGSSVFSYCTSLNRATLPNSLTSVPNYTFDNCSALTSVSIPNSAKSIGDKAFCFCKSLTSVSIPNSVNSIGSSAFESCGITEITIPAAVNSIGNYAFRACSNLNTIKVDPANTVFDSRNNCNALMNTSTNTLIAGCNSTIIPNDCQTIGEYAFYYSNIKNLTIPASVTTIGNYAFYYAKDLSMITFLGQTAPTFSYYSFHQAYGGVAVIPSGCLANYSSWTTSSNGSLGYHHWNFVEDGQYFKENGIVYSLDGTTVIGHDGTIPESVTIREGVTTISQYAFDYWTYLKNITLPASVTSIASLAFEYCTGIKSVTSLAVTAPSITSSSFYYCSKNVEIRVPKGSAGSYSNSWMQTGNSWPGDLYWTIVEF